ncbi:MAG: hypothetical protein FWE45_01995 [Firmicutes bacterium]|nr:hypothetical protein [Bacillota bacterium]
MKCCEKISKERLLGILVIVGGIAVAAVSIAYLTSWMRIGISASEGAVIILSALAFVSVPLVVMGVALLLGWSGSRKLSIVTMIFAYHILGLVIARFVIFTCLLCNAGATVSDIILVVFDGITLVVMLAVMLKAVCLYRASSRE